MNLIKNLSIGQKLNLVGYIGIFSLIFSSFIVWVQLQNFGRSVERLQTYKTIETNLANIRVGYNAVKGDLLLMFILDPNLEAAKVIQTQNHFKSMESDLKLDIANTVTLLKEDPELLPVVNQLTKTIDLYLDISNSNMENITNATITDSVAFATNKDFLINQIDPIFQQMRTDRDNLMNILKPKTEQLLYEQNRSLNFLIFALILTILVSVVVVYVVSHNIKSNIIVRLTHVQEKLVDISKGELPTIEKFKDQDEISTMGNAFGDLVEELQKVMKFTVAIGNGKYDEDIVIFKNQGQISQAIHIMRDSLKKSNEEDKNRNWAAEGLAKFAEILRSSNDLKIISDNIVSNLVKYTNSNQASLFITNTNDPKNVFLELKATYAYNKKKFLEAQILPGEGLVGQVYLERQTIYLTDVPQNYVKITSGLGEATPNVVLIVPIQINEDIEGVLEIVSFNSYLPHEIAFIEKLSENIATIVAGTKINERTNHLLQVSQQQTEDLRSQEEEVRQNMEELSATQEEMVRKENEYVNKINALEQKLAQLALTSAKTS